MPVLSIRQRAVYIREPTGFYLFSQYLEQTARVCPFYHFPKIF